MSSRISATPELSAEDKLEEEIANLKAKVESLKNDVKLQATTLLTAESTRQMLQSQTASRGTDERLLKRIQEQTAHKQQCLYRACAAITAFRVQDPDPNAVDGGNVLGLRFEVMSSNNKDNKPRFIRPYYVMLNRPYTTDDGDSDKRALRVHRHTVPPFIPLSGLAARYLPPPKAKNDQGESKGQDLALFARALRRELVRYHNRAAVVGHLKKAAGLGSKKEQDLDRDGDAESDNQIVDIGLADAEAKQVSIDWRDGRSGRLVMDDDGEVVKMVVQGANGRDRETVREFLGGAVRVEEVTRRLRMS
ncbi:cenp-O kinetochore centromere component [Xylariaceae sp. FL0594]|nr:cenp-O kinetochore centromere component [Xylariaceae sp. FL0594]